MYISFSWRNIWRNKKRTLISAASVFFAVLCACLMRSAQYGSYSYMIDSSAKLYLGYLQVHGKNYWENRSLDKSIIIEQQNLTEIQKIEHLNGITPRLESYALVSNENYTKVSQVIGIIPELENNMTGLKKRMIKGSYLTSDSEGVLVAEGLAEMLKVTAGDSIVIFGQGYHGQIAADRVAISGIVKLPFQSMNNGMAFLSLNKAQEIYSAPERITSLSILIENIRHLKNIYIAVREIVGEQYDMMRWDEMMPELLQNIQVDNASGLIMLAILYIVIGFGVFGTVMMMTSERTREFGVLVSVGMKKRRLIMITTLETIFVSFVGVFAGIIGSYPLIRYLVSNPIPITGDAARTFDQLGIEPIFMFSSDAKVFVSQAVVVLIIALSSAIYPVLFIRKLDPVKAINT
jgi:ABC-type lipoprotein release transport system permease subunit